MFTPTIHVSVFIRNLSENAKPVARQGRKATDLPETAGLPEKVARLFCFETGQKQAGKLTVFKT